MVSRGILNLNKSARRVKLIDFFTLLQGKLNRIVQHFPAVYILIEIIALRIAVTTDLFIALLKICLLAVFTDIHITDIASILMPECSRHHALHDIQFITETQFHCREVRCRKPDTAVSSIRICIQCAVIEMLNGNRHTVACPRKVFGRKHQIAALEINACLTKATKCMRMGSVRGVYAISGFVSDDKLRGIIATVCTAVKRYIVIAFIRLVNHLKNELWMIRFPLIHLVYQGGNIEIIAYDRAVLTVRDPHFCKIDKIGIIVRCAESGTDFIIHLIKSEFGIFVTLTRTGSLEKFEFRLFDSGISGECRHIKTHIHAIGCVAHCAARVGIAAVIAVITCIRIGNTNRIITGIAAIRLDTNIVGCPICQVGGNAKVITTVAVIIACNKTTGCIIQISHGIERTLRANSILAGSAINVCICRICNKLVPHLIMGTSNRSALPVIKRKFNGCTHRVRSAAFTIAAGIAHCTHFIICRTAAYSADRVKRGAVKITIVPAVRRHIRRGAQSNLRVNLHRERAIFYVHPFAVGGNRKNRIPIG